MRRPRIVTYNLASVDGRLTIAPGVSLLSGDARWTALTAGIGDPYDWVRAQHDPQVLLEGSGSFVPDDVAPVPAPAAGSGVDGSGIDGSQSAGVASCGTSAMQVGEHFLPDAVTTVPDRRWFAVVDGHGRVDLTFTQWPDPAWSGWHALVLTSLAAPADHLALLRERGIPYLVVGAGPVDLPAAMDLLGSRLGVRTVVCTGGGRLGGALLRAGLVDEVDLDLLPALIGGRGTPALFDAPPLGPDETPIDLDLLAAEVEAGGRLRLRYAVRKPADDAP